MIIRNGYIALLKGQDGGLDDEGFPMASQLSEHGLLPCQWNVIDYNRQSYNEDELVTRHSYRILVDKSVVASVIGEDNPTMNSIMLHFARLRLHDKEWGLMGEFNLKRAIILKAVNQVELTV